MCVARKDDRHTESCPERQLIIAVAECKDENVLTAGSADLADQLRRGFLVGGAIRVIDARNHEPLPVPFQYAVIVLQTDDAIAVQQIAERLPHGAGDDPLVIAP